MEQYGKSAPRPAGDKAKTDDSLESRIRRLEDINQQYKDTLAELQTEIRRLKTKLDRHAEYLNKHKKNS